MEERGVRAQSLAAAELLDPMLTEIRVLLEQHQADVLKHIRECVSLGLSKQDKEPTASVIGNMDNSTFPKTSNHPFDQSSRKVHRGSLDSNMTCVHSDHSIESPAPADSPVSNSNLDNHSSAPSSTSTRRQLADASTSEPSCLTVAVRRVVRTQKFELACAFLILLNSALIGVDVEVNKDLFKHHKLSFFFIAQCCFCLSFTLELILRMISEGFVVFFTASHHIVWNYIDLIIVVITVFELTIHIILLSIANDDVNNQLLRVSNVKIMRILRVLRLLRTLRMARVLRFVRQLRLLVHSIISTLFALGWSMVLLLMIIYVFAVLFAEEAIEVLQDSGAEEITEGDLADVDRFFGSLPVSMYTLFKSVCGGLDWDEPARALGKISLPSMYLFTAYVAFVYFAVLNVVTGVFCTCAIESNLRDHEHALHLQIKSRKMWREKLQNLFLSFDQDSPDVITMREFARGLRNEEVQAHLASLELEPDDAWTLFELLDTDKNQTVDVREFVLGCLRLKGQAKSMDLAKLMYDTRIMAKQLQAFRKSVEMRLTHLHDAHAHSMSCLRSNTINQSKQNSSIVIKPSEVSAAQFTANSGWPVSQGFTASV